MITLPIEYESSYFCDLSHLVPDSTTISSLMQAIKDYDVLPSIYGSINKNTGKISNRIRFQSSDSKWLIDFDANRIQFKYVVLAELTNLVHDFNSFLDKVSGIMDSIHPHINRSSNRMSLVLKGLSKEYSDDELINAYSRLVCAFGNYQDNPVYEWTVHLVVADEIEVQGKAEKINLITDLRRQQGQLAINGETKVLSRLNCQFEVNTFQENTDTRFGPIEFRSFLHVAQPRVMDLAESAKEHIDG